MKNHKLDPASDANRKQESNGSPIKNWGFGALATGAEFRAGGKPLRITHLLISLIKACGRLFT
jgi:hypothetical protein